MGTQKLKEALAGPASKEKGPPVADGILSVTPDPPEVAEWRNKSVLDTVAADSSFLDDTDGKRPNELFGKFTWRIENFSEISKRELRSHQFDVGEYKWYILVYPQGCDVCNHLSLFLCVADYDKLLPGWSHFAQFTIAVVNKDPKKSKYSDTLHRFCKKEHDWGWKKFMELSKVLDGFTVADTLVIKAQVQVILDRPSRPFRCLDAQYRRELVRVYLTNVESICRRFCEDRRQRLSWLREEGSSFGMWWRSLAGERRKQLTTEKGEAILKGVVKQFFNEKEVTSTLVMDALYCGCRQLECLSRKKGALPEGSAAPCVVINGKALTFSFALDALEVIVQLAQDFIPALPNDKVLPMGADGLGLRSGCDEMSELRRDALERDEKRLAELGRRTVEMYALAHIFTERLERAYRDHQAERRMKDLIAEEEEAGRLEDERAAARAAADKEKRAKKKERKKAKKEADKAKREAEEAERTKQEQEKRAEIERRVAEANERRRQEEEAAQKLQAEEAALRKQRQQQQQQQPQQQQQQPQQQQPLANGLCSTAENGPSSNSIAADGASSHDQLYGRQQADVGARGDSDADGPSVSAAATASGRGAAGSKYSSSSSPAAPASVTDDASEVASTSDLDDSSSMEVGSSKGFTPVVGRHAQHNQHQQQQQQNHVQQQQQQQQQPGPASIRGQAHGRPPQQPGAPAAAAPAAAGQHPGSTPAPTHQQPQQHTIGSIPTGYAAAVAGMRPPPPAEVVSAAAALAEQARRVRLLEEQQAELLDQVSAYKQQVKGLEASIADKDAALARLDGEVASRDEQLAQQETALSQKDAAIAKKDAALAHKEQEVQELRGQVSAQQQQMTVQQQQLVVQQQQLSELRAMQMKTANELRAAQAVNAAANAAAAAAAAAQSSSRTGSRDGGPGRQLSAGSDDGSPAAAAAAGAMGSSRRPRGHSMDLTSSADALASSSSIVAGPSPSAASAPWAAIAAGTASAAGAVGSTLRDSGTASSSGSQDLGLAAAAAGGSSSSAEPLHDQRNMPGSSSSGSGVDSVGGGAQPGPLSYAESVSGLGQAPAAAGGPGGGGGHSHHMAPPGLQSHLSGVSTPRAQASTAAGPGPGSSSSGSGAAVLGPGAAGPRQRGAAGSKTQLAGAGGGSVASTSSADDVGTPRSTRGEGPGRTHSPGLGGAASSSLGRDGAVGPSQNLHSSIGRAAGSSRFNNSTSPQQQQQQQYGSSLPSSSRAVDGGGLGAVGHRPQGRMGPMHGKGLQPAAGSTAGVGAGQGSYLSNGVAGVLHSSVPPSSSGSSSPSSHPSLHSYRNAAAGAGGAAGMGPSSMAAMAAAGSGAGGMSGMLDSMQGGAAGLKASSNLAGKVTGALTAQQHPFAYAGGMPGSSRAMHGFGSMAAPSAKGPSEVAAQRSTSTSSITMDDSGLDGFVHMHMIDDLLTE